MKKIILTATVERLGDGTSYANVRRNYHLRRLLRMSFLEFRDATGFYKGVTQGASFIVDCAHSANVAAVIELAELFEQESIIVDGALTFISGPKQGTKVDALGCVEGDEALKQDGYTLSNGKFFSYLYPPGTF